MFCHADRLITPRDTEVVVEGARFQVLRLPGHAPEHLGFVTPDGVAYLGDALMSEQVLNSVHIPYSMCCELDIQTKRNIQHMDYDAYIIPHNAVCTDVRALVQQNICVLQDKIETVYNTVDHYMSMEQIVARASAAMGVRGDTTYKINVAERNIRIFVEHLLDTKRLRVRANEGVIEYIRRE